MRRATVEYGPDADKGLSDTRASRTHIHSDAGVDYLVGGCSGFAIGTIEDDGQTCAVITLLRDNGPSPFGLEHTMSAQEARDTAAALIECAEELEASAATIAASAINKAARE